MTMDATVETSGRSESSGNSTGNATVSSNQPAKRSFDVAFLTGISDDHHRQQDHISNKLLLAHTQSQSSAQPGAAGKSAFKKVSKSSTPSPNDSGSSGPVHPMTDAMMAGLTPGAYHHHGNPFFPAIATTLSLQLLQQHQNTAAKGLAMSLFSHPATAAAVMAAHQQSLFQQQTAKSGGITRGNNFIEDYLRAQATLYQHQESLLAATKNHSVAQQQPYQSSYPTVERRPGTSSTSMAPPPTPPAAPHPPAATPPTASPPTGQQGSLVQLPAAALAASLASAPSQNVCARCSLTFRMTSDLVYHMRSQHRRDGSNTVGDSSTGSNSSIRQKRQEKLRCPVCGENFRERHHLTRHMTSHEDREPK